MGEPFWLGEASAACPTEAIELMRLQEALQALPNDAPVGRFVQAYEDRTRSAL